MLGHCSALTVLLVTEKQPPTLCLRVICSEMYSTGVVQTKRCILVNFCYKNQNLYH